LEAGTVTSGTVAGSGDARESTDYHRGAMTDQLTLILDPALPNPPATLRPMLARPLSEAFDSAEHLFEPAWGGRRVLAIVGPAAVAGGGDVAFVDEAGEPLTFVPPELSGLGVRVAARSAVLDGELVVVDGTGRADPEELARRLEGSPGRPVAFLVFDLLHLDGRSLISMPLERRRDLLRRVLHPGDEVLAVPAIPTEGRALFEAGAAQGLAGVLARQRTSPYLPGIRSRLWRYVPTGVGGKRARAQARREAATSDALTLLSNDAGAAPVLALIRRLPLGLDDVAE
jgi:bifunctional non-homologous end joining protein LigD